MYLYFLAAVLSEYYWCIKTEETRNRCCYLGKPIVFEITFAHCVMSTCSILNYCALYDSKSVRVLVHLKL